MENEELDTLLKMYDKYWETEEINIDLANRLVDNIPYLVGKVRRLNESLTAWQEGRGSLEEDLYW